MSRDNRPIGFAQYGTSHPHATKVKVIRDHPEAELRGVWEPDRGQRDLVSKSKAFDGVHWYESLEDMLSDQDVRAVAIEGPVEKNLRYAREVVEAGRHVWLDKPAGQDWSDWQSLVRLARERGLLIQLGYMFRYNAGFQFMTDWVQAGRLGRVFAVRGRMSTSYGEDKRGALSRYPGGILFELLCHLIDQVVFLLGRPDRVTSFLRNDLGTVPGFRDNTLTVLEYPSALVSLESAAMEVDPFPARRFEIYGTEGSLVLQPIENRDGQDWSLDLCLDEDRDGFVRGWQKVPIEIRPRYVASLDALVAAIRGLAPPSRSLDHELLVQETFLRACGVLEG